MLLKELLKSIVAAFVENVCLPFKPTLAALSQVTARKPRWEQGARAAIALKPRSVAAPAPTPPASAPAPAPAASVAVAKAWMLDVDGDGGEELLDDEDLLTEEDRARPAVPGTALYLVLPRTWGLGPSMQMHWCWRTFG